MVNIYTSQLQNNEFEITRQVSYKKEDRLVQYIYFIDGYFIWEEH